MDFHFQVKYFSKISSKKLKLDKDKITVHFFKLIKIIHFFKKIYYKMSFVCFCRYFMSVVSLFVKIVAFFYNNTYDNVLQFTINRKSTKKLSFTIFDWYKIKFLNSALKILIYPLKKLKC